MQLLRVVFPSPFLSPPPPSSPNQDRGERPPVTPSKTTQQQGHDGHQQDVTPFPLPLLSEERSRRFEKDPRMAKEEGLLPSLPSSAAGNKTWFSSRKKAEGGEPYSSFSSRKVIRKKRRVSYSLPSFPVFVQVV